MSRTLVFIVDDEPAIAKNVAEVLEVSGFTVALFNSPVQALAAAVSLQPDLLVSDFKMPEMDGLTLATKLREMHPNCKVLMMSGAKHDAMGHPARGKYAFLQKPFSLSHLLAKVNEALGS